MASPRNTNEKSREAWIAGLLQRFERRLCRFATRLVGDPERARDVVQETFLRLCREPREAVESQPAVWLFTVCRNHALDVRRKEAGMRATPGIEELEATRWDADPARRAEQRDEERRAERLIERLPATQREVLLLKFQEGLSYKEIAGVTGRSVSNVGFLIHRGMRALRERMRGASRLERAEG